MKNKCKICEYYKINNKLCLYKFIRIEYSTSYNNCKYFKKNSNDKRTKTKINEAKKNN